MLSATLDQVAGELLEPLAPSGSIVTTQPGISRPATGNAWSEADLAYLAARFELGITKAGCGLYALTSRKHCSLPMQESE